MANNSELSPAAKEARRKYKREWNRTHPSKQAEYTRNYWERVAAKEKEAAEADSEKES